MSATTDALANLSLALKDAIAIIKQRLLDQASSDNAKLEQAHAELEQVKTQYQDALTQLAAATTNDTEVSAAIASATADLNDQLKDLAVEAQGATPA